MQKQKTLGVSGTSGAFESGTFFGMKVLFEKSVGLYPVKVRTTKRRTKKRSVRNSHGSYR